MSSRRGLALVMPLGGDEDNPNSNGLPSLLKQHVWGIISNFQTNALAVEGFLLCFEPHWMLLLHGFFTVRFFKDHGFMGKLANRKDAIVWMCPNRIYTPNLWPSNAIT